jgi:protein-S-isoprenylcysteine O-methyltransferase Ste14
MVRMRRSVAAAGSAAFFVVAPGSVVVLVPWAISGWRVMGPSAAWAAVPVRIVAAVLIAAGAAVLLHAFARFAVEGLGTPLPAAPPERLVVGGLFRYVRNPMYVALIAATAGQALLFWQPWLAAYCLLVAALPMAFVHWYEEPKLRGTFGAAYEEYRANVPGWWPRLRPWQPGH